MYNIVIICRKFSCFVLNLWISYVIIIKNNYHNIHSMTNIKVVKYFRRYMYDRQTGDSHYGLITKTIKG